MSKLFRILLIAFLVFVPIIAVDAQASSEASQTPIRGEGVGRVSGYDVSNVHYQLAEDPFFISAVELDLDSPASQVLIGFDSASGQTFSCFNVGQGHWFCEVNDVELKLIETLRVIAVG